MDKNNENNTPKYIEAVQSFEAIQKLIPDFEWINNITRQQIIITSTQKSYEIFDNITKELTERNIDTEVIGNIELSKILKLYFLSNKTGLTYADLVEDSLKMFGELKYEQAVAYLESLNRRKEQITKNDLKVFSNNDNIIEKFEYLENSSGSHFKLKIEEYKQGKIVLTEQEKKLLAALKKNKLLKNKELANILGYSVRNIETICAKIREKFEIDFVEDKSLKRHLLVALAQHIDL